MAINSLFMCILSPFYIKIYPFFNMDIFLTLETGIYLVKLEFTFATQLGNFSGIVPPNLLMLFFTSLLLYLLHSE